MKIPLNLNDDLLRVGRAREVRDDRSPYDFVENTPRLYLNPRPRSGFRLRLPRPARGRTLPGVDLGDQSRLLDWMTRVD